MNRIQRLELSTVVGDKSASGGKRDIAGAATSTYQRVTSRLSSKRSKAEQWIAAVLIVAGVASVIATSVEYGVCLWVVGGCLYCHSRFLALWCDEA